jgi:hypothetical protein
MLLISGDFIQGEGEADRDALWDFANRNWIVSFGGRKEFIENYFKIKSEAKLDQ